MTNLTKKHNKRWGKKHIDLRDWPQYNKQLVKRGEYLLDLEWVQSWDEELKHMNKNKVGHPYIYPNSLIRLQAIWHAINMPYRMIEGMTRRLCKLAQLPEYNDYSTVNRRVNKLEIMIEPKIGKNDVLFGDGSGFQAIAGGEYLRSKYGKKNRSWIQAIVIGNTITKEPVSFEVQLIPISEPISVERQLGKFIDRGIDIGAFGGDGGFDSISLWNYLEEKGIRPIIKSQKNARNDSKSPTRNEQVSFLRENGYKAWANGINYGKRWPATEGIFSAVKRIFGEQLAGTSEIGMVQEVKLKFWAYKSIKRYGERLSKWGS